MLFRSRRVLVLIILLICVIVGGFLSFTWLRLSGHRKSNTRGMVVTQANKATQGNNVTHQPQPAGTGHNVSEHVKNRVKHDVKAHHTFHPLPKQGASTALGGCRLDPMAGVWGPSRLRVYNPCISVSGTVESIVHEPSDSDYHIDLLPDTAYKHLLNSVNYSRVHGDLVVEIIPLDSQRVPIPVVGQHIQVTGAYVMDTGHGWMEIHPAWFIDGKGSASYTPTELAQSMQKITSSYDALVARATISIGQSQLNVKPLQTAFVTVSTAPEAGGSLRVIDAKGIPMMPPLYAYANSSGAMVFRWPVGSKFTPGSYTVIIQVYKRQARLQLKVT